MNADAIPRAKTRRQKTSKHMHEVFEKASSRVQAEGALPGQQQLGACV